MKTKFARNCQFLIVTGLLFTSLHSKGQYSGSYGIMDHWYINLNCGFTSFFGDVSSYDTELVNKLKHESAIAIGGIFGKEISPVVGIRGQLIYGSLIGIKSTDVFKNTFLQNTFQLTINAHKLFFGNFKDFKWNLYGYGGMGMINFRSVKRNIYSNEITATQGFDERNVMSKSISKIAYTLGGGIKIFISQNLELNLEASVCPGESDMLDTEYGKTKMCDIFTYCSMGFTYKFEHPNKDCCGKIKHKGFASSRKVWQKRRSSFAYKKKSLPGSIAYKKR